MRRLLMILVIVACGFSSLPAAELLFPQERQAFYAFEPIEIAVAGLPEGSTAKVEVVPTRAGVAPLVFTVVGKTGTTTVELISGSLAPSSFVRRSRCAIRSVRPRSTIPVDSVRASAISVASIFWAAARILSRSSEAIRCTF